VLSEEVTGKGASGPLSAPGSLASRDSNPKIKAFQRIFGTLLCRISIAEVSRCVPRPYLTRPLPDFENSPSQSHLVFLCFECARKLTWKMLALSLCCRNLVSMYFWPYNAMFVKITYVQGIIVPSMSIHYRHTRSTPDYRRQFYHT